MESTDGGEKIETVDRLRTEIKAVDRLLVYVDLSLFHPRRRGAPPRVATLPLFLVPKARHQSSVSNPPRHCMINLASILLPAPDSTAPRKPAHRSSCPPMPTRPSGAPDTITYALTLGCEEAADILLVPRRL